MNKKVDLKHYLSLHYSIRIDPVVEEGEQYFLATARELDKLMFYGVGCTEKEAIEELKTCMREMFVYCLDEGIRIPEPQKVPELHYSGKFMVRTSPHIHGNLAELARDNNQSMNSCLNTILTQYITAISVSDFATAMIRETLCTEMKKVGDSWKLSQQETKSPPTSSTKEVSYATAS